MLSYELYKSLHFFFLFVFLATTAGLFFDGANAKLYKMASGIAMLFVLITGMGLVAKLGQGFHLWETLLVIFLLALTGFAHIAAKRMPGKAVLAMRIFVLGMGIAAFIAVYKP